ncbi:unnamed protein product [Vicia faba]|uniref:Uncharacterized protein n=1 Tax=Vicia faba TaxID=3906 RepID=A0AAV1A3F7_VICFA|nr:unnamed protein product [Vicia faba]
MCPLEISYQSKGHINSTDGKDEVENLELEDELEIIDGVEDEEVEGWEEWENNYVELMCNNEATAEGNNLHVPNERNNEMAAEKQKRYMTNNIHDEAINENFGPQLQLLSQMELARKEKKMGLGYGLMDFPNSPDRETEDEHIQTISPIEIEGIEDEGESGIRHLRSSTNMRGEM